MTLTLGQSSASFAAVTDGETLKNSDQSRADGAHESSLVRRVIEWFWRGSALTRARRSAPQASEAERAELFARRARASSEVARIALASEPLDPAAEAIACELYRQSAYWAAAAASAARHAAIANEPEVVWDTLAEPLWVHTRVVDEPLERLQGLGRTGTFVSFAEAPANELRRARVALRGLTEALLAQFELRYHAVRKLRYQRLWRLGLLALLALFALEGLSIMKQARDDRNELAANSPWKASSSIDSGCCTSPQQDCPESIGYFFHTTPDDPDPWVEFDLRVVRTVSHARIENRRDCCAERADLLALEVSRDHKKWQTVARHDGELGSWRPTFDPTPARWVRVHLLHPGILHLSRVMLYP